MADLLPNAKAKIWATQRRRQRTTFKWESLLRKCWFADCKQTKTTLREYKAGTFEGRFSEAKKSVAIEVATNVERLNTHMGNIAPANGDDKSILSLSTVLYITLRACHFATISRVNQSGDVTKCPRAHSFVKTADDVTMRKPNSCLDSQKAEGPEEQTDDGREDV
jgi:hypothetical protein